MPKISDELKEKKQFHILKNAMECFALKGYRSTTIDDIMLYANVSKGAVYTYFSSKEDIFLQLLEYQTKQSFESMHLQFAKLCTASEKIRFMISRDIPLTAEKRAWQLINLEFWMHSSRHQELQLRMEKRYSDFRQVFMELVKEGIHNGEFRQNIDRQLVSSLFWAMRDGICLHFTVIGNEESYEKTVRGAEELIFRYLMDQ